ncbi:MAG: multidrug MFS transporter [Lachnospiraceae bacterium]|nr:multidrug MFS transporter [Lachnospiraceae bacterium]
MIFVTVGTHEQQFDRLVRYMDEWAGRNDEKVIIQTGYSRYNPENCECSSLLPHEKMMELAAEARIVISHGGPSSFIIPLQAGRIPIVVPRRAEFNEHINDHQLQFCRELAKRWENVIVVEDIDKLADVIGSYEDLTKDIRNDYKSNNENFCREFESLVASMNIRPRKRRNDR